MCCWNQGKIPNETKRQRRKPVDPSRIWAWSSLYKHKCRKYIQAKEGRSHDSHCVKLKVNLFFFLINRRAFVSYSTIKSTTFWIHHCVVTSVSSQTKLTFQQHLWCLFTQSYFSATIHREWGSDFFIHSTWSVNDRAPRRVSEGQCFIYQFRCGFDTPSFRTYKTMTIFMMKSFFDALLRTRLYYLYFFYCAEIAL